VRNVARSTLELTARPFITRADAWGDIMREAVHADVP
jgi:hypothetical protein